MNIGIFAEKYYKRAHSTHISRSTSNKGRKYHHHPGKGRDSTCDDLQHNVERVSGADNSAKRNNKQQKITKKQKHSKQRCMEGT